MPSVSADPASTGERVRAARAVLVTVHGTFARGAPWAEVGSILARSVMQWFAERGCTATVMPFQWSGRNSIAARRAAGASLAECLDRIRHDDPQAALYVIAHSHGGSVFAYATKLRPEIVDKVDGFVALATPWVGLEPCNYAAALREMLAKLTVYAAFVLSLLVVPSIVQWAFFQPSAAAETLPAEQPSLPPLPRAEAPASSGPFVLPIGRILDAIFRYLYSLVAAAGLGLIFFFPLQRFVSQWLEDSTASFQRTLDSIAQASSTLNERLPPSVFLKPIGDEAALALTWTSAMAALMQGASGLLFLLLQWVRDRWAPVPRKLRIIGGLLLTAAWSMGTVAFEFRIFQEDSLASALATILRETLDVKSAWDTVFSLGVIWALFAWATTLLIVFAFLAVLLVAMLAAVGAGVPSLKTALYFRILVEAIPIGSHRLVLVDVSPPPIPASTRVAPGRLSHSAMYNSPGAIRAVIEAFTSFETARSTAAQKGT